MSQVIAIANQKGGVSKTTTTASLGVALANEGKKVLLVDLDAQANLTMAFGVKSPDDLPYTIADVLDKAIDDKPIDPLEGIIHHEEGVDIMPSSIQLSGYDSKIVNEVGRENLLKQYIEAVRPWYDHILLDCQPSLNIMTINAFAAADSLLVPTQPQFFSAKGLEQLFNTYSRIRRKINPNLTIEGVLITMMDKRPNFTKEVADLIRNTYGNSIKVFDSEIPYSIRAAECSAEGRSIFAFEPGSKLAAAYSALAKEVLDNAVKEKQRGGYKHAPVR